MARPYLTTMAQSSTLCHVHHMLILLAMALVILLVEETRALISTVQYLPGFQRPLPFYLETGYVGVGESENVQLFYYFAKSERTPEKDPLLLWLTGGPGCSGWSGLVHEIGPLKYKNEPYNGSLPTLDLNQYSWTKVSSIIFVDSPVGAGFSYPKTPSASKTGDFKQVQDLVQFFKKWLINIHPEYISNPIYIAGDSYSGITLPIVVQEILNGSGFPFVLTGNMYSGIEEGTMPPINLQGYILGNPITDPSDNNYRIPFAHGMALISDELYKSLKRSCRGEYFERIDPSNTKCLKDFQAYEKCISGIQSANILDPLCPLASPKPRDTISIRRWLNQNSQGLDPIDSESPLPSFGCPDYDHLLSRYWANDPRVREALHVRKGHAREWKRCDRGLPYDYDVPSSFQYHVNLSAKGFRSLIYSGDHDMIVPFLGTQAWIRSLNYSIVDDWRSWIVQGQVAGYTRTYSNQMTFATVKGGGHTAPRNGPKECFAMFQRWIDYESL